MFCPSGRSRRALPPSQKSGELELAGHGFVFDLVARRRETPETPGLLRTVRHGKFHSAEQRNEGAFLVPGPLVNGGRAAGGYRPY